MLKGGVAVLQSDLTGKSLQSEYRIVYNESESRFLVFPRSNLDACSFLEAQSGEARRGKRMRSFCKRKHKECGEDEQGCQAWQLLVYGVVAG